MESLVLLPLKVVIKGSTEAAKRDMIRCLPYEKRFAEEI